MRIQSIENPRYDHWEVASGQIVLERIIRAETNGSKGCWYSDLGYSPEMYETSVHITRRSYSKAQRELCWAWAAWRASCWTLDDWIREELYVVRVEASVISHVMGFAAIEPPKIRHNGGSKKLADDVRELRTWAAGLRKNRDLEGSVEKSLRA
ncbi:hypothetical protein B0H11DRAFT_1921754 [Mycena galericulata]|nr:hypothetical protein B0H11DRAFT_1921754 [Mycena galericulata]